MPKEIVSTHEVHDDTERPLNLRTSDGKAGPALALGQPVLVSFTVQDARDLGQIQLVASDGRVFNASIGCLEATAILPGYEQVRETPNTPEFEPEQAP